jgi:hypothetical protein
MNDLTLQEVLTGLDDIAQEHWDEPDRLKVIYAAQEMLSGMEQVEEVVDDSVWRVGDTVRAIENIPTEAAAMGVNEIKFGSIGEILYIDHTTDPEFPYLVWFDEYDAYWWVERKSLGRVQI